MLIKLAIVLTAIASSVEAYKFKSSFLRNMLKRWYVAPPSDVTENSFENYVQGQQTRSQSNDLFPFKPDVGYISLYEDPGNDMFYWHFPAEENPETAPILIWLQGGPGCASTLGLFTENGPLYVNDYKPGQGELKADKRVETWNQKANMIFPDYPLGVGFSTVTEGHVSSNKEGVIKEFQLFYQGFLEKYPQYKGRDIFISGESYGGHWVPYTSYALHSLNNPDIPLKGFAIGNGFISWKILFTDYPAFSLKYQNYTNFNQADYNALQPIAELCGQLLDFMPNPLYTYDYNAVCNYVNDDIMDKAPADFDPYYMPSNETGNSSFYYFLNNEQVQAALGVNKPFHSCNGSFGNQFAPHDFPVDSRDYIVPLLKAGVNVMVYDGALDWICNYEQEELVLDTMQWNFTQKWKDTKLEDCEYGLCKEVHNLKYVRFAGAGHMVPSFRPQVALDMINMFMDWVPKEKED